jgi:hypothetical protein
MLGTPRAVEILFMMRHQVFVLMIYSEAPVCYRTKESSITWAHNAATGSNAVERVAMERIANGTTGRYIQLFLLVETDFLNSGNGREERGCGPSRKDGKQSQAGRKADIWPGRGIHEMVHKYRRIRRCRR